MSESKSQAKRTLDYMREHNGITSFEAMKELGIISFPKRICELRALNYEIEDKWEEVENRFGDKIRVKRYFLIKEPSEIKVV